MRAHRAASSFAVVTFLALAPACSATSHSTPDAPFDAAPRDAGRDATRPVRHPATQRDAETGRGDGPDSGTLKVLDASDASDAAKRDASDASHDASRDAPSVDARDATASLVAQAGFFEVPPQATGAPYRARMFWSFRPADDAPETKPLFVLYNGGPGSATTAGLLPYGTGPTTLDPDGGAARPNPASFTRFANLLYIDDRQAGFSYGLSDGGDAGCTFSVLDDAVDFIRVLKGFLDAHDVLARSTIVLVGESYGGTRSTATLYLAESAADHRVKMPSDVRSFFQDHAAQFGQAVLIEPLVAGGVQWGAQTQLEASDPYLAPFFAGEGTDAGCRDPYDVQQRCGWSTNLENQAGAALANATTSTALVGVDLSTVPELLPPARLDALRTKGDPDPSEHELVQRFGALRPGDFYWTGASMACSGYYPPSDYVSTEWVVQVFLAARLFITNARYDQVIYSPAIPYVFNTLYPTTVDTASDGGVARPGWIRMAVPADGGTRDVVIRFPPYNESGHMVAVTQGADLAADVEEWLAAGP